jgi:hypothetical protein
VVFSYSNETFLHDNARNMSSVGKKCPEWDDLNCFGHTIQLCIKHCPDIPAGRTLDCKFQNSLVWCSVTVMKLFVAFDIQVSVVKDTLSTSFKSDVNYSFLSQYIISILDFTCLII